MEKRELQFGDVVQLNERTRNPHFAGAFMAVTEPKPWGAQGFVHGLERGRAYYRATFEEMDFIGRTDLMPADDIAEAKGDSPDGLSSGA